jgi:hypothetical protein
VELLASKPHQPAGEYPPPAGTKSCGGPAGPLMSRRGATEPRPKASSIKPTTEQHLLAQTGINNTLCMRAPCSGPVRSAPTRSHKNACPRLPLKCGASPTPPPALLAAALCLVLPHLRPWRQHPNGDSCSACCLHVLAHSPLGPPKCPPAPTLHYHHGTFPMACGPGLCDAPPKVGMAV